MKINKAKIKNKIIKLLIVVVIITGGIFYANTDVKSNIYDVRVDNSLWLDYGNIGDNVIDQQFYPSESKISGIQLQITTIGSDKNSKFKYALLDSDKNELAESYILFSDIKSGRFNKMFFEKDVKVTKGEQYFIRLSQETKSSNSGFWVSYMTPRALTTNSYYENDKEIDATIIIRTLTHRFNLETYVVFEVFAFLVIVFLRFLFYLFRL